MVEYCILTGSLGILVGFFIEHILPAYDWEVEGKQRLKIAELEREIRLYKINQRVMMQHRD